MAFTLSEYNYPEIDIVSEVAELLRDGVSFVYLDAIMISMGSNLGSTYD